MNKKLTKKKILMGALIISAMAIPITGVLAYENDNNTTTNEVTKEKPTDDKMTEKNNMGKPRKERKNKITDEEKTVTNDGSPPELPDGENPEMNGEAPPDMADGEMPPEMSDGEKPGMNGETPPDIPNDKKLTESNNNKNFFDMLKKLPTNFVNWLKNLFSKK